MIIIEYDISKNGTVDQPIALKRIEKLLVDNMEQNNNFASKVIKFDNIKIEVKENGNNSTN